ncbi:MAG TPA: HAMP domain-containing sensor histidine kinase [Stellaceae bacterium]|jgi:signal transduction histidine kinase|nr:HAMP domain-containing sensor histidine kinase [Stellaceae bacterium]
MMRRSGSHSVVAEKSDDAWDRLSMSRGGRASLSTRLIRIVVPLVLLAGFLAAGVAGGIQIHAAQKGRLEQARLLGHSYAALLRDYVVDMDTPQLAPILKVAASNGPVVCASLTANGLPLRYGWPSIDCTADGRPGRLISTPIMAEGREIAMLNLRLQESFLGSPLLALAAPGMLVIATTLLALGLVLAVVLRRQVAGPIQRLTGAMQQLSGGSTLFTIPEADRHDEIGEMARALTVFRHTKIEADRISAELREAQDELIESAKLAFLGSMVAGVAHEVNTPIGICVTAVATADDLLKEAERSLAARELTEADLIDFFAKMRLSDSLVLANLERAATLVRSFKGIATDQASEMPRRLDLGQYLREVVASLQPELKRTRVEVVVEADEGLEATVLAGALWQIVSNLVLNGAVHAFDPGASGTITLTAGAERRNHLRLSYRDDGKGMAPAVREHIFEPFFTTRRGQGGTGLGLFITYNLVTQSLGGRINCESEAGQGTRFDIVFPITPPKPRNAASPRQREVFVP